MRETLKCFADQLGDRWQRLTNASGAHDSDFELEDGVTVVTGETDDEMDEDGSGRCVRSPSPGYIDP